MLHLLGVSYRYELYSLHMFTYCKDTRPEKNMLECIWWVAETILYLAVSVEEDKGLWNDNATHGRKETLLVTSGLFFSWWLQPPVRGTCLKKFVSRVGGVGFIVSCSPQGSGGVQVLQIAANYLSTRMNGMLQSALAVVEADFLGMNNTIVCHRFFSAALCWTMLGHTGTGHSLESSYQCRVFNLAQWPGSLHMLDARLISFG